MEKKKKKASKASKGATIKSPIVEEAMSILNGSKQKELKHEKKFLFVNEDGQKVIKEIPLEKAEVERVQNNIKEAARIDAEMNILKAKQARRQATMDEFWTELRKKHDLFGDECAMLHLDLSRGSIQAVIPENRDILKGLLKGMKGIKRLPFPLPGMEDEED